MDTVTLPTARTEIVSDTLSHMLDQFQHSPLQRAWVTAIAIELQLIENQIIAVWLSMMLPYANDVQLDLLGKIVGEKRYSRTDTDYRLAIAARIQINRGRGTVENILNVLSSVLDVPYRLRQRFPAGFSVDVMERVSDDEADGLFVIINSIKGAGISASMTYVDSGAPVLRLSSRQSVTETDSATGLSDDAKTTGGIAVEYRT